MAYKFKNIEKVIGSFVIISILIIVAAIIFIARGQHLLTKKYLFTTRFNSAKDLKEGMPIKFKGLNIGGLKSIYLDRDNFIIAKFYILKQYAPKIKEDSVVMINAPLIGEKFLEVTPGTTNAKQSKNNSFLYSIDTEKGREYLTEQLATKPTTPTDLILKNVQMLTAQLSDPNGSFMQTLKNFQELSKSLAGNKDAIKETMDALKESTKSLKVLIKNLNALTESLKNNPLLGGWGNKKKKK